MAFSADAYLERVDSLLERLQAEVERVQRNRIDLDRVVQVVEAAGSGDGEDERT